MSAADATTALLVRAMDVVLPLITGNLVPTLAITTGTLVTTAVATRYSSSSSSSLTVGGRQQHPQDPFQKTRKQFFWLTSILGIFIFVKYPISSVYLVLVGTALVHSGALVDLPWVNGWPIFHLLVGLLIWFFVCVLASLTEDAIHFAIDSTKNAIKKTVYNIASTIGKGVRYVIVGLTNAIKILVAKLVGIPLSVWPWIIERFVIRADDEKSEKNCSKDSETEEAPLSDGSVDDDDEGEENESSEVNPLAEDYEDEYQFTEQSDCDLYFEEDEDFTFLTEQHNDDTQRTSTIRRSGRLFQQA